MNRQQRRSTPKPARQPRPYAWVPLAEIPRHRAGMVGAAPGVLDAAAARLGMTTADLLTIADEQARDSRFFVNATYEVEMKRAEMAGWVQLTIRRVDGGVVGSWRDKQEIKNQLVGRDCEGVELFPAEERMLDVSNAYHLWVCADPEERLEVGWHHGRNVMRDPT